MNINTNAGDQSSAARQRVTRQGLAVALGAALCFGFSGPLAKALTQAGWSTGTVVCARLVLAATLVCVFTSWVQPGWLGSVWRHRSGVVCYGLISIAFSQFCFFSAAQHMSVGLALMLEYLSPVLVLGWAWATTRVRPAPAVLAGGAVALAGAMTALGVFAGARVDEVGLLWGLGAAGSGAAYYILAHHVGERVSPLALTAGGMLCGVVGVAALLVSGLVPVEFGAVRISTALGETSFLVLIVALGVTTACAYPLGITAISLLKPSLASLVGLLEVPVAALASAALLGERLGPAQIAGMSVLLLGVALTQRRGSAVEGASPELPYCQEEHDTPRAAAGDASDQDFLLTTR